MKIKKLLKELSTKIQIDKKLAEKITRTEKRKRKKAKKLAMALPEKRTIAVNAAKEQRKYLKQKRRK
jgi:hypothetical protein